MSFANRISAFTASQIIDAIGCPRGTAYDWLKGRREPPDWQQPHWLALIQRSIPKNSNKRPQQTPCRKADL